MASHALDQRLFEQTANGLGSVDAASPTDGVKLIDGWLKVIDGNPSAEIIEGRLRELRGQLQLAQPDTDRIKDLLMIIADHTSQVAQGRNIQEQTAGKLEDVATSLRLFADQL
ncbi:hypothetical protein GGR92_003454 [Spirosoma lacussanchae]|uniref:Uncharacterized protein n=1 Tax=Spirosoma sordidisoli TaxID=2502893 RepID=A0A4Q2UMH3_9BACT|nr:MULTISPECIES: hypothetical protein [Spirosoma]RYC68941.1 hypothetical protein EQG79_16180 [Spirosoma sordidisoli]